jgi:hypothetical protein
MTTESARDEAVRLAMEAGFELPMPEMRLSNCVRLIAIARQRPGWVWLPDEMTVEMFQAYDLAPNWKQGYRDMLAAAPKPEEGP